jgi:2,3-bisphosphoglycerate-independent phosphoglycerate mutase
VDAVLKEGYDFAYVHVEAPDEMGHQGSVERKVQAIENLDQRVIKIIKEQMDASGEDYCMMVLPDHPTPIRVRTHTSAPVPYLIYNSTKQEKKICRYSEKEAVRTGKNFSEGQQLLKYLLQ